MRIGMMADVYKPHISGITNYISLNKRYLEAAGHEVFIFTFGGEDYEDDEPNVIRSPGLPLVDTGYYLSFRYSRRAKALLQTMDVVHVHHPFLSGRLALRYCRPLQIPVIFTNHTRYDLYAQTYLPLLPEQISETFLETYMPPFCEAVDLVISPSKGMADILRQLGVTAHIEVVPNGVELRHFQESHGDCRPDFGFRPDDLLLVYSGRLAPEKNLDLLLQSFAATAEAVENAHLLLIGGGPEEEHLRSLAAQSGAGNRIHFTGMLDYNDLPRYLAMCDIFVTASVTEVHPLSVIEAMAAGLPAVGVRSVGVGDIIEDGTTGFLAREDAASFAVKLTRLCLDAPLRRRMSAASRKAAEKYDIERTNRIMLSHYERLVFDGHRRQRGFRYRFNTVWEKFRQ